MTRRLLILAALWAVFFSPWGFVAPAAAGEEQTTWRAGDVAGFRAWCAAPGPLRDIVAAPFRDRPAVIAAFAEAGVCVDLPSPLFSVAVIAEWVSGPHRVAYPDGRHETVSVWRLAGPEPRFVLMDDSVGDHAAVPERGI